MRDKEILRHHYGTKSNILLLLMGLEIFMYQLRLRLVNLNAESIYFMNKVPEYEIQILWIIIPSSRRRQ